MKLITFTADGQVHVGAIDGSGAYAISLTSASKGDPRFASMLDLIRGGEPALSDAAELVELHPVDAAFDLETVTLKAPLPNPVRLRDCSLFIEHLQPAFRGMARKLASTADDPEAEYERLVATGRYDTPEVFSQQVIYYNADHTAISGPGDLIVAPRETRQLDYELEFAAVIGRTGRDIGAEDAAEAIFGYTIFNDWSCRDLQSTAMGSQLGPSRGKDFDGSNTLGPCIVTADEITSPYDLELTARVNGEMWSHGSSSTMHHSFEEAVAHFSLGRTVHAGEVLGTGTVMSGSPVEIGKELKDGDEIELEVSGIGVLRNRVQLPY
ncbi:fumarylacetoacetate hydrolase family protein [Actinomadura madurae]|uniref:2-keto-4-pentenoate hydratase/2-oxohepta-3-ene-1,7-dioic acid hydratase (Catechol pathway) n=1 Tax=Actinomadura madurae TaxID=1993 RepID=A0A1I5WRL7_9ACTN|nr:fumarylacetoacetate hydrolase family protein [Actinomadura madurae]SFQ22413.1 2-keto-4-pentenoate hydratase/2-oxohepta-3-ene-1,7-dioic acid hydratase (catechol pathway) [Actinomadura madurae]SPT51740.1 Ureidoglycolate lyase [Actinomadura madurae]